MSFLQIFSAILGLFASILLFIGVMRGPIKQNFAAFLLWALLDLIAAVAAILEKGNYALPTMYAFTAFAIAIALVIKKQFVWNWVETMTAGLVIACLVLWYYSGNNTATIASSLAVIVAGIPQMVDTFKEPASLPKGIYSIYLVAAVTSLIAGRSWTIQERFYSGALIFLTITLLLLSFRKQKPHASLIITES